MLIKLIIIGIIIWVFLISFAVYACLIVAAKTDRKMNDLRNKEYLEAKDDLPY